VFACVLVVHSRLQQLKYTQCNSLHNLCYENIKFILVLPVAVNVSLWHVFVMQYIDGGSGTCF